MNTTCFVKQLITQIWDVKVSLNLTEITKCLIFLRDISYKTTWTKMLIFTQNTLNVFNTIYWRSVQMYSIAGWTFGHLLEQDGCQKATQNNNAFVRVQVSVDILHCLNVVKSVNNYINVHFNRNVHMHCLTIRIKLVR